MENLKENKVTILLILAALVAFLSFGFVYLGGGQENKVANISQNENMEKELNPIVILKTTMGDITLELYMDKTPITAQNFLTLAEDGFYNGTKFHRVINNFMIQGGDPHTKEDDTTLYGRGGPGYTIEDEFVSGLSNLRGTIAMANVGQQNTGGSQFFINLTNNIGLDFDKQPFTSKHPVFGQIVGGMDVVDAIAQVAIGDQDLPLTPVIIEEIVVRILEKQEESFDADAEENSTIEVTEEEKIEEASTEDDLQVQ